MLTCAERSNFANAEYKVRPAAQEKNASPANFFSTLSELRQCARVSYRAPADNKPAFPPVLHSAGLFSVQLRSRSLSTMKLRPFLPIPPPTRVLPPPSPAHNPP